MMLPTEYNVLGDSTANFTVSLYLQSDRDKTTTITTKPYCFDMSNDQYYPYTGWESRDTCLSIFSDLMINVSVLVLHLQSWSSVAKPRHWTSYEMHHSRLNVHIVKWTGFSGSLFWGLFQIFSTVGLQQHKLVSIHTASRLYS